MTPQDMDLHKVWTQLSESLNQIKDIDDFDVKRWEQSFEKKTKDINGLVKDIKKLVKEKDKTVLELDLVEKAIMKANSNIGKADHKCHDIQQYINKISKKRDENKENVENVMNVWKTIGLRVERRDQILDIKFNKISETDPKKWFSIKISLEDDNQIKVVECDPKDSLDTKAIEEFNDRTDGLKPDLRHLIVFLRNKLKTNCTQN